MKGTIVKCLREVVQNAAGEKVWYAVVKRARLDLVDVASAYQDLADDKVLALIQATSTELNISMEQAFEAFGIHWSSVYAPRIYDMFFQQCHNARDMLHSMTKTHEVVTRSMSRAQPPKFIVEDVSADTIVMHYDSSRGLVGLLPGLIRGVAKYYGETLDVSLRGDSATIRFHSEASIRRKSG